MVVLIILSARVNSGSFRRALTPPKYDTVLGFKISLTKNETLRTS
jgi:hypothetical protein